MMSLEPFLYLAGFMFAIGFAVLVIKRNAIFMLVGLELMLNAVNLNFVVFSKMHGTVEGQVVAVFVIVIAACEVAVGLAIILNIYKHFKNIDHHSINELKG